MSVDYNSLFNFFHDFDCLLDFKTHLTKVKQASEMLSLYIKYSIESEPNKSILYMRQFHDFCSGGSCYQALKALLSILEDGEQNAMQTCDVMSQLYERGDETNATFSDGLLQKGNRALIVHKAAILVQLINQAVIVESAYVNINDKVGSSVGLTPSMTSPTTFLDDLIMP